MPTFDYASTNVTRYLSDGSRTDIIHYIIVTGPENLRIPASDFPIRIAGADVTNTRNSSLANSASGPASGKPRANLEEEADPCLHDQVDSRGADVGSEHSLGFRWYFLSDVPAERYLYWSGLPATYYIPRSCLVFRHEAESMTYQFDWGAMAGGAVVYLCHGDGKVERLAPGDPIVAGLTFTSLGEPLDDVTGHDKTGLVTISPGCYQADLFIDRLMCMNGFGSGDGFNSSREEAIPLLLGMGSESKENISFYGNNPLASHQDSNTDNNDLNNRPSSQSIIRAMLDTGRYDKPDDRLVTGTDKLLTAESSYGNGMTECVGGNEISNDQSTSARGVGISALKNSLAALRHSNPNPFAHAKVTPLYPSVFSSGEQNFIPIINIPTINGVCRREVCVGRPNTEYSGQPADCTGLPEGTYDPRALPFAVPAPKNGGKRCNWPGSPLDGENTWSPDILMIGFAPIYGGFSDLYAFRARLGGVRGWGAFPPVQVAVEYLPNELKRLDWTGRGGDKGGLPDPILVGRSSSSPIHEGTRGGRNFNAGHW